MPRHLAPHVMAATAGEPDAVREHILDAAHRVIVERGLAAASTRAIAEEAEVGAGTLYNYFPDRIHLLVESVQRRAAILFEPLHAMSDRAGKASVTKNLQRIADEVGDVLGQLVPLLAAAFSDAELLEALQQAMSSHGQAGPQAVHFIEEYLRAEQELGRVAADADCRAAASLILSVCHERAFLHHFLNVAAGQRSIAREIAFVARALSPVTGARRTGRKAHASRRREQ